MNKTPKLLPWLARKAGISTEKATALWSVVVSDKSLLSAAAKDPDSYCRLIVERLQDRHGNTSSAILLNPFGLKTAA